MQTYKSRAELKRLAVMQLRGKWGTLIGVLLLQELIALAVTELPSLLITSASTFGTVMYYVVTFLLQLLLGVLQAGVCYLYLKAACGMEYRLSDMFYCFKNSPDKAIKLEFVLSLIQLICLSPYYVLSETYDLTTMTEPDELLVMMGLLLLCVLVYDVVTLCFTPVFYMMMDFPDYTVRQILVESVRAMNGNNVRFLLLQLSFIPWFALCMMTCGLGILWLVPYMNMTNTNFYLDLMANRNNAGEP